MGHRTPLIAAKDLGFNAFMEGKPYTANPFARDDDTMRYKWWQMGWKDGQAVDANDRIRKRYERD
jgi:hypothetical protein